MTFNLFFKSENCKKNCTWFFLNNKTNQNSLYKFIVLYPWAAFLGGGGRGRGAGEVLQGSSACQQSGTFQNIGKRYTMQATGENAIWQGQEQGGEDCILSCTTDMARCEAAPGLAYSYINLRPYLGNIFLFKFLQNITLINQWQCIWEIKIYTSEFFIVKQTNTAVYLCNSTVLQNVLAPNIFILDKGKCTSNLLLIFSTAIRISAFC